MKDYMVNLEILWKYNKEPKLRNYVSKRKIEHNS